MPESRYNHNLLLYLIAAGILSFLFSLVTMQIFFGSTAILWLTEKNSEKKKAFDRFTLILLIFLAVRFLSVFLSDYPDLSYQSLYKDALFYLSFFSLSFYFKTFNSRDIRTIILIFIVSFTAVALTGIIRFNTADVRRAETFTSGYTAFSTYLAAGIPVIMSFSKFIKGKTLMLLFMALAITTTGMVLSLGRFNILIAVLLFIAGIFIFKIRFRIILPVILILALSYISFMNNSSEAEGRLNQPVQLSDRDVLYEGALMLWKEKPLTGFGTRTFREIFPLHHKLGDKGVSSWHNDFLQIYFESGILGLAAFLLFIISLFTGGVRHALKNKIEKNYILTGILLALTGIFMSSLVTGFINSPVLSVYFAALAALLTALIVPNTKYDEKLNGN